jgi:hypothetical protein
MTEQPNVEQGPRSVGRADVQGYRQLEQDLKDRRRELRDRIFKALPDSLRTDLAAGSFGNSFISNLVDTGAAAQVFDPRAYDLYGGKEAIVSALEEFKNAVGDGVEVEIQIDTILTGVGGGVRVSAKLVD